MPKPKTFAQFQAEFFQIFEQPQFGGQTFLQYLEHSDRSGDEASVVDNVISGPLLISLGFSSGEQVYNAVKSDLSRPDFAPNVPEVGACFMVEDKATPLELEATRRKQLAGYVRSAGVSLGLLCNGREMQLWEFGAKTERHLLRIDVAALLQARRDKTIIADKAMRDLESLFDLLRREAFTDAKNLAAKLSVDAQTWRANAKKLGEDESAEPELVEDLKQLVAQLHRDARRQLDLQLNAALELKAQLRWADDSEKETVEQVLEAPRELVKNAFVMWRSREEVAEFLSVYAEDPRSFTSREFFVRHVLEIHNRTHDKPLKAFSSDVSEKLERFAEVVLSIHSRQTRLRQKARVAQGVEADFVQWKDLVSETMLGDLSKTKTREEADDAQRAEFALQAAYVVFIRLLLIRVCEDKEIFPERFLSNGGLLHWQEDIKRYLKFVRGNRYEPLLKMAYDNAANIYAHFFTGRELFNWYQLGETALLEALSRLAKYDFAQVDSDLLGTVYNAYVERHEKKKQGQYYTPIPIVDFILDEVGWQNKAMIGDQKRLIDPACGSGTFLVRAAKRLMDAYRDASGSFSDPQTVLSKVRDKIYGFDLNPFACYLSEVNLLIQVLDAVRALPESERRTGLERFHIYNVDALAKPGRGVLALGHDSLLAEELDVVERIKGKQDAYASGFSHVVANPPYGAKLSDDYKRGLKRDWEGVFRGQPDTYVFFYALALELLGIGGRMGFITPNTFLMGTNTDTLRGALLEAGRIERIVDLPQGIWRDAAVDCVLLFLKRDADEKARLEVQTEVNLMDLRDTLDKLTAREWAETLSQSRSDWTSDPAHAMDIRRDAIQSAIEAACIVTKKVVVKAGENEMEFAPEVLHLGDLTDSSQGIIPYKTEADGKANLYIRAQRDVPTNDNVWKPLLDTSGFIGRYEMRWGTHKPHLKYGKWLWCERESKYFDSPKLLYISIQNQSVRRRLKAVYDEAGFYNRHNFNNIIAEDANYNLRYILALFNSKLLNYWYGRKFRNVNINPNYVRDLPIFPADAATQLEIVALVDELLGLHRELNGWREKGYRIELGRDRLEMPFDLLLAELQSQPSPIDTLDLLDARTSGHFSVGLGDKCTDAETLSERISIPAKFPTQITLKFKRLWLDVPDEATRRFLLGLLRRPQFAGKSWHELQADDKIRVPQSAADFARFFDFAAARETQIRDLWSRTLDLDRAIDERVLDLYGITDPAWRAKILDSAPVEEDEPEVALEDAE